MRILNTNFHDYYDSVQIHGQDKSLIYLRKRIEIPIEKIKNHPPYKLYTYNKFNTEFQVTQYIIGFCNKIYLCTKLQKNQEPPKFAYNLQEVEEFIASNYKKKQIEIFYSEKWQRNSFQSPFSSPKYKNFKETFELFQNIQNNYKHLFQNHPIFTIYSKKIIFNDCLKNFEFYKIFDSFSAFQEISMFLGNQAIPIKPIPHIPDKIILEIKGFNKFSFRKDKK